MKGYAKLGWLMGNRPETAILRCFSSLSVQKLLYLQAELTSLEQDLRRFAAEDDVSSYGNREDYSTNWRALKASVAENAEDGKSGQQWETMLAISEKLEEYQIALLRHREMNAVPEPLQQDLEFLMNWMSRPDMGGVHLDGDDRLIWTEKEFQSDLLTLKPRMKEELFYHWISSSFINRFHTLLGYYFKATRPEEHLAGTVIYDDAHLRRLTRSIATVFACMLPVLSIVVLYVVQAMSKRLGIVAAFTIIFSVSLVTMTSAEMGDIFAATAAYALVQVVFIGTTGGNCSSVN
ncbi:uncharacterized protein LY89DRAFT_772492 [Mollisia scopiformis]|uniref:DUF6594 domain-containing protein n=1 Tax=Mollisia scopiformis TaxID=149040 RepID=A0A194XI26_MOLSC|nr:uncharacterized protein LY89DRAFT_772492 [Mollisia scopiformis]KUJ19875.1 hypothetical protein LY89DRAFT_772492 [Mollisia scopiformis]